MKNEKVKVTALRGNGTYVGDPKEIDKALDANWSTGWNFSAQANGEVTAKFVTLDRFYELSAKHPEMDADGRAGWIVSWKLSRTHQSYM